MEIILLKLTIKLSKDQLISKLLEKLGSFKKESSKINIKHLVREHMK